MYFTVGDRVKVSKPHSNIIENYLNLIGTVLDTSKNIGEVTIKLDNHNSTFVFSIEELELISNKPNKYTYFISYSYDSGFGSLEYFTTTKIKNFDDILSIIEILKNKGRKDPVIISWQLFDD